MFKALRNIFVFWLLLLLEVEILGCRENGSVSSAGGVKDSLVSHVNDNMRHSFNSSVVDLPMEKLFTVRIEFVDGKQDKYGLPKAFEGKLGCIGTASTNGRGRVEKSIFFQDKWHFLDERGLRRGQTWFSVFDASKHRFLSRRVGDVDIRVRLLRGGIEGGIRPVSFLARFRC